MGEFHKVELVVPDSGEWKLTTHAGPIKGNNHLADTLKL